MRKLLQLLIVITSLLFATSSYAQLRSLPANAKRITVGSQQHPLPYLNLGGKTVRLAPGGVIYDQDNRTIVHGALPPGADVVFTTNMQGEVARIYILTPLEQAQLSRKK